MIFLVDGPPIASSSGFVHEVFHIPLPVWPPHTPSAYGSLPNYHRHDLPLGAQSVRTEASVCVPTLCSLTVSILADAQDLAVFVLTDREGVGCPAGASTTTLDPDDPDLAEPGPASILAVVVLRPPLPGVPTHPSPAM
jgi:hypothetical protein